TLKNWTWRSLPHTSFPCYRPQLQVRSFFLSFYSIKISIIYPVCNNLHAGVPLFVILLVVLRGMRTIVDECQLDNLTYLASMVINRWRAVNVSVEPAGDSLAVILSPNIVQRY